MEYSGLAFGLTRASEIKYIFYDDRYLLQEKKRGKALDSVGNFHLQNGAVCYSTITSALLQTQY